MSTDENKALVRRWEKLWNQENLALADELFAPTGRRVTLSGIDIFRIVDGKIAEEWSNADGLGLLQQLGIIPSMG